MDVEERIRAGHPLRHIRKIANAALLALDGDFAELYPARLGRPSIPPERLLRAMLLQAFYGIRSERQLMERIEFDLLFRWFVGLGVDEAVWDHSSFTTNRERLLSGEIAAKFLRAVLPRPKRLFENVLKGWSRCDSSLGCGPERAVAEWQDLRSDRSVIRPT